MSKTDPVQVLTTTPPTEGGIAEYSAALYESLEVEFLGDGDSWTQGSLKSIRTLARDLRGDRLHVQHEWLMYGSPVHNLIPLAALVVNRLKGGGNIVTLHTVLPIDAIDKAFLTRFGSKGLPTPLAKGVVFVLTQLLCLLADRLIVHTPEAAAYLEETHDAQAITVIPHGLDKQDPAFPEPPMTIRYVGLINEAKGVDVLLDAIESVDTDVDIIGRVQDSQFEGDSAIENTYLSAEAYQEKIRTADVLVLPYLKGEYFAASGVLADAMAHGTGVIVSDIPQLTTVVEDGETGFVVPRNDASALADAIERATMEPELVRQMAKQIHEVAASRDWERVRTLTQEVYDDLA